MPAYQYSALGASGLRTTGTASGADEAAVRDLLRSRGLLPLRVDAETAGSHRLDPATLRTLASLLESGLPLTEALRLATELSPPRQKGCLRSVLVEIIGGSSLHSALAAIGKVLPPHHLALIRVGERSGNLAASLDRVAESAEADAQLREDLLTSALYPALLVSVGIAAFAVLILFVIPRFAEVFDGIGLALPPLTAGVLGAAVAFRHHWVPLLAAATGVSATFALVIRAPRGRSGLLKLLLRLPVVAVPLRASLGARFGRTLVTVLAGGATLADALGDVQACFPDTLLGEEAGRIRRDIRSGSSFGASLRSSAVLPQSFCRLAAAGERSARLNELLDRATDMLEVEVKRRLNRLTRILEPAITLVLGLAVGLMALSLLQAVYGINASQLR